MPKIEDAYSTCLLAGMDLSDKRYHAANFSLAIPDRIAQVAVAIAAVVTVSKAATQTWRSMQQSKPNTVDPFSAAGQPVHADLPRAAVRP